MRGGEVRAIPPDWTWGVGEFEVFWAGLALRTARPDMWVGGEAGVFHDFFREMAIQREMRSGYLRKWRIYEKTRNGSCTFEVKKKARANGGARKHTGERGSISNTND